MNEAGPNRLVAIVKGLCPRCRRGSVFGRVIKMNDHCPSCGIAFSREPGYFSGAMYFSYILGVGVIIFFFLVLALVTRGWSFMRLVQWAAYASIPFIPFVFFYSRVLWIHFDRHFEP